MITLHPDKCIKFFEALREGGKAIAVHGYFDPPTPTHLVYFQEARNLGDLLGDQT
jgi:hypothetical protein